MAEPSIRKSQPTGCFGRRIARTAPTVDELSIARTNPRCAAVSPARSLRPSRVSVWLENAAATSEAGASSQSSAASAARSPRLGDGASGTG